MARAKRKPIENRERAPARVVYVQPPITLATVVAREGASYRVRIGANEAVVDLDPCVDRALVDEALETGARVVVDPATHTLCGLLTTSRTLRIDHHGDVRAHVRTLEVTAQDGVLLKTPSSFFQLDTQRLELFASETVVRARDAFRALAQLIKLN